MKNIQNIDWLDAPEPHNYPAALSYLSLLFDEKEASKIVKKLKKVSTVDFKSKDVFRASALSLLGISNSHVEKNIKKMKNGEKLSPILLVRVPLTQKLIIADGYHRMCAVYQINEDEVLKCKIVSV